MQSLVEQVRKTIAAHALCAPGDTVVVGVSGGPDSLALLDALVSLDEELRIALHVAHLNHQLRGAESEADAKYVAQLARRWGLNATIGAADVAGLAAREHLSIEEAARSARYVFLTEVAERVGASVIAVAHNADDQVETVLMHFLRGAGLAGLRGMPYQLPMDNSQFRTGGSRLPIVLVRPLLDVPRSEVEAYCKEHGLAPRLDASNTDTTFFRNRLRHEVLPYLATLNPNIRDILRRTARVAADDYAFLQDQVDDAFIRLAVREDRTVALHLHEWRALPVALQRGTLREAVRALRGDLRDFNWEHVEAARAVALTGQTGAMATLPRGLALLVDYKRLLIGPAARLRGAGARTPSDVPQLAVDRVSLTVPGTTRLPDAPWSAVTDYLREWNTSAVRAAENRWTALLDADACRGELVLRRRRPGDRFQPAGLGGHTKLLAEFMIDARVPRAERERLPLLVAGDRIVWVCGWRVDERARVREDTRQVLVVMLKANTDEHL